MKHKTVFLYVEDNADDITLLRHAFRSDSKAELHVVNDGLQSIQYLVGQGIYSDRARFPLPEVILLDLKLPRIDGFGVLEWLHSAAPWHLKLVPVIVMSSSDEVKDVNRAYALGADCYLTKPLDWKLFQKRMSLLDHFSPEHAEKPTV